jgi:predicted phosphodiesterase
MTRLLAFSDIHGNVRDVETLVQQVSGNRYDGVIVAGDFTNALIDLVAAQACFERIADTLRRLDAPLYYVLGNRDGILTEEGIRQVATSVPTYLDRRARKRIRVGETYLTGNPKLANRKTIYVTHSDGQPHKEEPKHND